MAGKADIVDHIVSSVEGLSKKQASETLEALFGYISDQLVGGDRVQIAGFGTFTVSERGERQGRNPQTGQPMTISASKNARFKAAKALKDALN